MKDVKIIIDGKEYTAQMSDEQVKEIAQQERARTGYEQVKIGELYYAAAQLGTVEIKNSERGGDAMMYRDGNYVNNKRLGINRHRAEALHRQLEQWQALHDESVDWGDTETRKWYICYDYSTKVFAVRYNLSCRDFGKIMFSTEEKAQEAIEAFRDELMWYFTEYRSRLDEKRTGEESEVEE